MGARRWFIYVPEIDPDTFVFFFYKGNTGRSWSVRDYSTGRPVTRYAKEFNWTAEQVLELTRRAGSYAVPATKAPPTDEAAWYQEQIRALNDRHLGGGPAMGIVTATALTVPQPVETGEISTADLIAAGESRSIEFKQSARFNAHTNGADKNLEYAIVKSVAGFMNASGGVLLIGVNDNKYVVGMDPDYGTTGNNGRDGFENWLVTKLGHELGKPSVASFVEVGFEGFDKGDVCRVNVQPSNQPVYVGKEAEFLVRMGNSTRLYNTRDALEYIKTRW